VIFVVAFGALLFAAIVLAARLLPEASGCERACGAAVLFPALAIGIIHALGAIGAIAPWPWIIATLASALIAFMIGGAASLAVLTRDLIAVRDALSALLRAPPAIAALVVGASALGLAAIATYLLVPWAWDSLGYHLPIVHDALQTRTLRHVPTSVVYVNVYPRLVDIFFIAWRLSLPGETWIELGQLPFAIGGVIAIATLAERANVPVWRGVAFGALWLAIPVALLELASTYVDIAVGALVLLSFTLATGSMRPGNIVVAGIAIGLLLGSKPSAPPMAALAMLTLLWRSHRSLLTGYGFAGCSIGALIGIWKYVENIRQWRNPIWPADVRIHGFSVFEGKAAMAELATSGLREPYLSQGWLGRVVSSWTAIPDNYVYDMRIGGFGPLFTFALMPLALLLPFIVWFRPELRTTLRRVALPVVLILLASLASPGAFWARYTIAIPGALLALAIAFTGTLSPRLRLGSEVIGISLALLGIALSWRGFSDGGPSLWEIAQMPEEARISAYALDEQEDDWHMARERVGPGEAFGYDWSFGLPGRLFRHDGQGRVAFLDETTPTLDELLAWVREERVRVIVLGEGPTGAADTARAAPEHFRELFRSDYPEWQPCAVFETRGQDPGS
jgi:hypothetical protein